MIVYLTELFAVYFLLFIAKYKSSPEKKQRNYLLGFSLAILVIIAGIRYNVGTDFPMYRDFFYSSARLPLFSTRLEFVFVLFCKLSHAIFYDSVSMFLAIALMIYACVYKSALKDIKYFELCIFLFITFGFYTNSFNVMRQWMAIPYLYLGMSYFNEKDYKKAIALITIGVLSHYTSIVTLPLFYFATKIKKDRYRILIILISIFFFINLSTTMNLLFSIFKTLGFGEKYLKYFTRAEYISLKTNIFVYPMFTLVSYIGYYLLWSKKDKAEITANQNFIINTLVFGFSTALFGTRNVMFQRVQLYFVYSLIFAIPIILEKTNPKLKTFIYFLCLMLGTVFYVYSLGKNGGEIMPYMTIFSLR